MKKSLLLLTILFSIFFSISAVSADSKNFNAKIKDNVICIYEPVFGNNLENDDFVTHNCNWVKYFKTDDAIKNAAERSSLASIFFVQNTKDNQTEPRSAYNIRIIPGTGQEVDFQPRLSNSSTVYIEDRSKCNDFLFVYTYESDSITSYVTGNDAYNATSDARYNGKNPSNFQMYKLARYYASDYSDIKDTKLTDEVKQIKSNENASFIYGELKAEETVCKEKFADELAEENEPVDNPDSPSDPGSVDPVQPTEYEYKCAVDHKDDVACGSLYFIPSEIPALTNLLMNIIKILTPIILIIKGLIDLFKAITGANEKEIEKARGKFFKRLIPAITVFLVILIVQFVFGIIATDNENNNFLACSNCFLNNKCPKTPQDRVYNYCLDMQSKPLHVPGASSGGYSGGTNNTGNSGNNPSSTGNTSNGCTALNVFNTISVDEAKNGLKTAVDAESSKRAKVVAAASYLSYSFPGLPYFGGGGHGDQSTSINTSWGSCKELEYVTSSKMTKGNYYPYGMDCSGFVNWSMYQGGINASFNANDWSKQGTLMRFADAGASNIQVGDLLVKYNSNKQKYVHVGIIIGYDSTKDDFIIAEEAGFEPGLVRRYLKNNESNFTHVVLMDDFYNKH